MNNKVNLKKLYFEIKQLIEERKDINAYDENGYTYLMKAVETGDIDLVNIVLESGANVNLISKDETKETALTLAAFHAYSSYKDFDSIIVELVKKGANIDYQNYVGWTALMFVSERHNDKMVEFLLKNNASLFIKKRDSEHETAYQCSQRYSGLQETKTETILRKVAEKELIEKLGEERFNIIFKKFERLHKSTDLSYMNYLFSPSVYYSDMFWWSHTEEKLSSEMILLIDEILEKRRECRMQREENEIQSEVQYGKHKIDYSKLYKIRIPTHGYSKKN